MLTLILLACMHIPIQQDLPYNSVDCDNAHGDPKKCTVEADEPDAIHECRNDADYNCVQPKCCNGDIVFDNTHLMQQFNEPRAADETDGKPGAHIYSIEELEAQGWKKSEISVCKYQVFADGRVELDGPDCPRSVVREAMHPAEPVDVPAVQETRTYKTGFVETVTTCADKTRVLWHDESNPPRYWCHKVEP